MVVQKIFIVYLIAVFSSSLFAGDKKVFYFTPLPTKKASKNIEEFFPLNNYLEKKLSISIQYNYKSNYQDILNGFKDGTIDIAYLGPLPLVSLYKEYPFIAPLVSFKNKNGTSKYRCTLSKFRDDKLQTSKQIKIALTQPLSTCGYLMSKVLLEKNFNIDLEKQKYFYTMSHTNALEAALRGDFLLAGSKESIAKKYESLGMEIIAKSELLPGFSIVANKKTLSAKQIEVLQKTLLEIPQETYSTFEGMGKYGTIKSHIKDYEILHVDFFIPYKGNINEAD